MAVAAAVLAASDPAAIGWELPMTGWGGGSRSVPLGNPEGSLCRRAARSSEHAPVADLPPGSRFDATLTRLFTPSAVPEGTYRVYTTPRPLSDVTAFYRDRPGAAPPPDAWHVGALEPLQALGSAGLYNRSLVARLYVGRFVSVARGSISREGRVGASITLLSPYPNAQLTRLVEGTMIVVFLLPSRPPGS